MSSTKKTPAKKQTKAQEKASAKKQLFTEELKEDSKRQTVATKKASMGTGGKKHILQTGGIKMAESRLRKILKMSAIALEAAVTVKGELLYDKKALVSKPMQRMLHSRWFPVEGDYDSGLAREWSMFTAEVGNDFAFRGIGELLPASLDAREWTQQLRAHPSLRVTTEAEDMPKYAAEIDEGVMAGKFIPKWCGNMDKLVTRELLDKAVKGIYREEFERQGESKGETEDALSKKWMGEEKTLKTKIKNTILIPN